MYITTRASTHGVIWKGLLTRAAYSTKCPQPEMDTGCTYCMPDMSKFPDPKKRFPIMPFHSKQLVINTGTSDWPSKIGTPGSLAGALEPLKRSLINTPALITNSDLPNDADGKSGSFSAHLYPDGLYFPKVHVDQAEEFATKYLNEESIESEIEAVEQKSPLVLVCGHGKRDERCGIIAPMLIDEFRKVLEYHGRLYNKDTCPDGVQVASCSHIGGHAFAGNIIYHDGKGSTPIWYSTVFPHHIQGIVKETIMAGNIIEELHRK